MTKEERREYMKRWRAENREHINAYRRAYYLKHILDFKTYPVSKEKNTANAKRWREANKEHYNAYQREYHREYRKRKAVEMCGVRI